MRSPLLLALSFCGLCLLGACGGGGLRIVPPPLSPLAITSGPPPAGTTGSTYAGSSGFPLRASGGLAPYTWRWAAAADSSLPPGLTLSKSSISGTPTTPGSYNVIVTVADSESPLVQKSVSYPISIDTSSPSLEITSGFPPNGIVGLNYGSSFNCVWSPVLGWHLACVACDPAVAGSCPSTPCPTPIGSTKHCFDFAAFSFTVTGGVAPYIWRASGMPPGLTLDPSSGEVNGMPTSAGSYYVSVMLSDSESPPAQATANYTIDIGGPSATASATGGTLTGYCVHEGVTPFLCGVTYDTSQCPPGEPVINPVTITCGVGGISTVDQSKACSALVGSLRRGGECQYH